MNVDYIIIENACENFRAGTINFKYIANEPWFEEQIIKPTSVIMPRDITDGLDRLIYEKEQNERIYKPVPSMYDDDYIILQYFYTYDNRIYYFVIKVIKDGYKLIDVYETFKDAINKVCHA